MCLDNIEFDLSISIFVCLDQVALSFNLSDIKQTPFQVKFNFVLSTVEFDRKLTGCRMLFRALN